MVTPIVPPIEPMLAKVADELPPEAGFIFEPKWDGFRAIARGQEGERDERSRRLLRQPRHA